MDIREIIQNEVEEVIERADIQFDIVEEVERMVREKTEYILESIRDRQIEILQDNMETLLDDVIADIDYGVYDDGIKEGMGI